MKAACTPLFALGLAACVPVTRDTALSLERDTDWHREHRPLGAGILLPSHVVGEKGVLRLITDGRSMSGASIRTRALYENGDFRGSMRCAAPRGTVCALFLYEPDAGDAADEIDIELIGGSRDIWLTAWRAGVRTSHVALQLPFDPAVDFHVYEIRRRADVIAFLVDGVQLAAFDSGLPARRMALFANAWWPTWLDRSAAVGELQIEWIERPVSTDEAIAHGS